MHEQINRQLQPLRETLRAIEQALEELHAAQRRAEALLTTSATLRRTASEQAETLRRALQTSLAASATDTVLPQ